MALLKLFLSFLQIGLFSIGGGYAAIPLIQSQTVDIHGWLTAQQFMDLATIAEMTPGPIAVNGATFGCILPSLIIVSLLSYVYTRFRELPMLKSVLSSMRPAVVALIAAAGINMLLQVAFGGRSMIGLEHLNWIGTALFIGALIALRRLKLNPILVMLLCGAGGLLVGLIG